MAGLFDSALFDPSSYNGGMSQGLLGYLAEALRQKAGVKPQDLLNGPNPVVGGAGPMQVPTFGQPDTTTLSAQSVQPQMQQPQPPQQLPTALQSPPGGNLGAGLMGLLNAGSPLQGIGNLISGLATGQRTDPSGMLQQSAQATYQALKNAGVPDGVAQAAALNPEVLKTIAPQLYTKPTLQKVASDPLTGQESYVWNQPDLMKVSPAVVNGQPVTGAGNRTVPNQPYSPTNVPAGVIKMGDNELTQVRDAIQSGATGEDFIKQIPNRAFADKVKGIANGDLPYPTGFIMKTPYGQMLTDAVSAYKPGVTAQDFPSKQKARNFFTSGPGAAEIKAINTAIYHADKLMSVSDKMGGTDIAPGYLNPIIQGTKNNFSPEFQDSLKQWDAISETLATEVSKALNGGVPHVADKEHWREILSNASGPTQRAAAVKSVMNILGGRTQALAQNYQQSQLGAKDPFSFIDPENRPIFERLQAGKSAAAAPTAPGSPPTATGPNGKKLILKNGQWVPLR